MFENVEGELVNRRYRVEMIGQYHQAATEVVLDKDDRAVLIEPGTYPVVASVSLDSRRINEGGVIFDGRSRSDRSRKRATMTSIGSLRSTYVRRANWRVRRRDG